MKRLNLIHLAPSDKFKTGIASYADIVDQIFRKYLSNEVRVTRVDDSNYLSALNELDGELVVLAQMGSNEGAIFRALLEQKRIMPNLPRIIEIHDPPLFVLSYTKFLETISRWLVGRGIRRFCQLMFRNYYTKLLIDKRDVLVCKTNVGATILSNTLVSLGISTPVVNIDLPNYLDLPVPKKDAGYSSPCVGFFGYISPDKGVHVLVDAAVCLTKRKGVNALPLIHIRGSVAAPCYSKYLNDLKLKVIEAGLQERVRFGDFIPFDELPEFVNNLTAVALPYMDKSRTSASGPLLWARTCNVPIIAHHTSAFEASIRNGIDGLLIPINDIESWATVLDQIRTVPLWGNKFHKGIAERNSETSWEAVASKYLNAINKAVVS
jgi:glycosyltransferase involved in cell wall biosynthesis